MTQVDPNRDPHNRRPDDRRANNPQQTSEAKIEWTNWAILLSIIVLIVGIIVVVVVQLTAT